MKKYCFVLIGLFLFLLLQGTMITVDIDGTGDYTSIQEGVDASTNGDTVLVYPGRYYENVDYNNHTITLGSLNLTTGERHYIRETIIDGNLEDSCIIVKRAEGAGTLLCGFTITNGSGHYIAGASGAGGGVFVYGGYGAQLEVRNCNIENNRADGSGGGICLIQNSYGYISGTTIKFNYAYSSSGGILKQTGSTLEFDPDNLCSIYGNYASYGCMMGRGINLDDPDTLYFYADTLSFEEPDRYFIYQSGGGNTYINPDEYMVIESQHCYYDFIDADLYVSPDGNDANSGLTPHDPKKTIASAITLCVSNPDNPNTVHLLPGYYSPSLNDQYFALNMREYVSLVGTSRDEVFLDRETSENYIYDMNGGYNYSIKNITFTGGIGGGQSNPDLRFWDYSQDPISSVIMDSLRFDSDVTKMGILATKIDFEISNIIIEDSGSAFLGYHPFPGNRSLVKNVLCRNCLATSIINDNYIETEDIPVLNVINYLQVENSVESILRMWNYGPVATRYAVTNFINCTLMNNSITPAGDHAFAKAFEGGEINFYNSIIYGNVGTQLNLDTNGYNMLSTATISHTLLQDGETGIVHEGDTVLNWMDGNLDCNPMLNDDYIPLVGSPVIDAGTMELPEGIELPDTDVYGNPRIYGNGIDIGAVEWQGTGISQEEIIQKPNEIIVYPNPLISNKLRDGQATIFWQSEDSPDEASIEIFNIKGQRVRELRIDSGTGTVNWDLCNAEGNLVSTGVYFVRMKAGNDYIAQSKLTIMK